MALEFLQKKKIKNISLLSVAIIMGMLLIIAIDSFFKKSNQPTKGITQIYFADNISIAHEALIKQFNETYRGKIEVIPINLPFSKFSTNERKELLTRSLRSKSDLIDVFAVDLIWVPRFAKWSEPVHVYINTSDRENILPEALQSCYYGEQLVALPLYIDIGMMYYRRDLLQSLPGYEQLVQKLKNSISWEELIQLKKDYFSTTQNFYLFAAKSYEGLICSFIELLISQNENLFNKDVIRLDTPEARKALNLLVDLVHTYRLTPAVVVNFDEYQTYLYAVENDAVFLRGWPGFLQQYPQVVGDTTKFRFFEMAALPHLQGAKPLSVYGGWNLMISKYSNHKWAALKFIQYALQPESQKILYTNGGYIPVNLQVYQDSTFMHAHPELAYYRELLQRGVHRPYRTDYTKLSDIISQYVHLSIKKELSPEEALTKITQLIHSDRFVFE